MKKLLTILSLVLFANQASAEFSNIKVLFSPSKLYLKKHYGITDEVIPGLSFVLDEESFIEPTINDVIEADPFNRGSEYDKYKYTSVWCEVDLFLMNGSGLDIAFRDPFTTVANFTFRTPKDTFEFHGNIGLSAILSGEQSNLLISGSMITIRFMLGSSIKFFERNAALQAVENGLCDLKNLTKVTSIGAFGEIMTEDQREWRSWYGSYNLVTTMSE